MEKLIAIYDLSHCEPGYHFVFEVDGQEVGSCGVITSDNYIHSLRVDKRYRNRGYARMMLKAVMECFAGQRMWLRAYESNVPAIKAYTAVGFTTFKLDDYKIASMEIVAPAKSEVKTCKVYGLSFDEEEYSFKNESDRNEFALSLWEEKTYEWWNRQVHFFDTPSLDDVVDFEEFIGEEICVFDVIQVED